MIHTLNNLEQQMDRGFALHPAIVASLLPSLFFKICAPDALTGLRKI